MRGENFHVEKTLGSPTSLRLNSSLVIMSASLQLYIIFKGKTFTSEDSFCTRKWTEALEESKTNKIRPEPRCEVTRKSLRQAVSHPQPFVRRTRRSPDKRWLNLLLIYHTADAHFWFLRQRTLTTSSSCQGCLLCFEKVLDNDKDMNDGNAVFQIIEWEGVFWVFFLTRYIWQFKIIYALYPFFFYHHSLICKCWLCMRGLRSMDLMDGDGLISLKCCPLFFFFMFIFCRISNFRTEFQHR